MSSSKKQKEFVNQEFDLLKDSTSNEWKFSSNDSINYKTQSKNILFLAEKTLKRSAESSSTWLLQRLTGEKTLTKNKIKRGFFLIFN